MKKIIQKIKTLILKVITYFFEGKGFVDNFLSLGTKLMNKLNFVGEKTACGMVAVCGMIASSLRLACELSCRRSSSVAVCLRELAG